MGDDVTVATEGTEDACCQEVTAETQAYHEQEVVTHSVPQVETANKIRALITEIGSSSLVTQPGDQNINFHPCPWCSGRLITV